MALEKTLRWFGPDDPVSLSDLNQAGIDGIVTALHHLPNGSIWPIPEILVRKSLIESFGLTWHVVESLPVSEGIKWGAPNRDQLIKNYQQSMRNLASCGIDTICYNFMPVLDWARTDLHFKLAGGGESMLFDYPVFAAFDIHILQRPGAAKDYPEPIVQQAGQLYEKMSREEAETLAQTIIVVTQGFIDGTLGADSENYRSRFLESLQVYDSINSDQLRENLGYFLDQIIPLADQLGINMAIHADDPAFPLLGLPRIVSSMEDLTWIFNRQQSIRNGLTFCSGSLATHVENNLEVIAERFADRIHFLHLRNTKSLGNKSFYESGHLEGDTRLPVLMQVFLREQERRIATGRKDHALPLRPDHGIKILDDFNRTAHPGYPLIGRLRGLAELKGLEAGILGYSC